MEKAQTSNSQIALQRERSRKRGDLMVCFAALGVVIVLAVIAFAVMIRSSEQAGRESRFKYCQEQIEKAIAAKNKDIHLYDSARTDELLQRLAAASGIEEVRLEMTDVTDEGMRPLAAVKGLRSLQIECGRVSDKGMEHLSVSGTLERLTLCNTRVGDDGLSSLKSLATLRSLNVQLSKYCQPTFTKRAVAILKEFSGLKELKIYAQCISDSDIQELRRSLPGCAVNASIQDTDAKKMTEKKDSSERSEL
jgi:hypothetical protein